MSLPYNTTDLDPEKTFERHVFHRDQFAHYMRWSHMAREFRRRLTERPTVVDFGCGKGSLFEVAYRNRTAPAGYIGLDIRERTIEHARERYKDCDQAGFYVQDLINPTMDFSQFQADMVCSFEVLEHVGKQNVDVFLQNLIACGKPDAKYFLSTPKYDERVGAADNHTYDSGDGRGSAVHEFTYEELAAALDRNDLVVDQVFGTFASVRDYKEYLETDPAAMEIFTRLRRYYDSELSAVFMAPIVPAALARNCLWVCSKSVSSVVQ